MGFSLLHAGLAAGAMLAAIPIILHLILRQKPRPELFPALRLIRQRHRVNLQKLRIRHWLLLAMRMLLIALMAMALARPSIHGATFLPDQKAPVAAAMVFDTSLSMEYEHQGKSRLREAQEAAKVILRELPDGSEVMVLDPAEPAARFFPDMSLARQRVDSLRLRPRCGSLNQAITEACRALNESDRVRKEIYVFTDLAARSFSLASGDELTTALASVKSGAPVYLFHVGVAAPRNVYISEMAASAEVLPANSESLLRAVIQDSGQGEEVLAEFLLDGQTRGTQTLALERGKAVRIEFPLPRLKSGVYEGKLVLHNGGDLKFDDTRFLAIEVRPVTRVLIVSDQERDSELLAAALAPELLVQQQRTRHLCERVPTTRLGDKRLADYDVVCLVNVQELPTRMWNDLISFVMSGGGLGVFVGTRVQPDNYNQAIAQDLLPVKLHKVEAPAEALGMQAPNPSHPVVKRVHEWDPAALGEVIVERYMRAELLEKDSRRIIDFSDGSIALAERTLSGGRAGRVALCTTSIAPARREKPWNDLPQFGALFVPLMDNLVGYLAGHADQQINYLVGQDVVLHPDRGQKIGFYLLHTPDSNEPTRRSAESGEGTIVVPAAEALGIYRVTAGQGEESVHRIFSLNADPAESNLEPLPQADLTALFGAGNFALARTTDELREVMGDVRIGRELFPWVMPLLVLIFATEHLLANRFYRSQDQAAPALGNVASSRTKATQDLTVTR